MSDNCISNRASDETYINLFRAIKKNGTLKILDVSRTGHRWHGLPNSYGLAHRQPISMELLEAVYKMLSCNNTLEELYLCGWNPRGGFWCRQELEPIAKGLVHNHALLKLGIEKCSIEPLKLQVAQLKQTCASKHSGPNPNLDYLHINRFNIMDPFWWDFTTSQ